MEIPQTEESEQCVELVQRTLAHKVGTGGEFEVFSTHVASRVRQAVLVLEVMLHPSKGTRFAPNKECASRSLTGIFVWCRYLDRY
jgi:hypothetical protein